MFRVGVLCLVLVAQGLAYTYPYNPCCQVGQQVAQPNTCCPIVQPPIVQQPACPHIVQPPIVQPPIVQPPLVQPPIVQPPIVQPPIVQPPAWPPIVQPPIPPIAQQPCSALCQGISTCCGSGPMGIPYSGYGGNLGSAYPYGAMGASYSQAQQVQQPVQQIQQMPGQQY